MAMLDTSLKDSMNSSCPVKIIKKKNVWCTDELKKLRVKDRPER